MGKACGREGVVKGFPLSRWGSGRKDPSLYLWIRVMGQAPGVELQSWVAPPPGAPVSPWRALGGPPPSKPPPPTLRHLKAFNSSTHTWF